MESMPTYIDSTPSKKIDVLYSGNVKRGKKGTMGVGPLLNGGSPIPVETPLRVVSEGKYV